MLGLDESEARVLAAVKMLHQTQHSKISRFSDRFTAVVATLNFMQLLVQPREVPLAPTVFRIHTIQSTERGQVSRFEKAHACVEIASDEG